MADALFWHRLQFAFTAVYHYLFPQLTMGLALLIVVMKGIALRTRDEVWEVAARFWIRIFGINFAVGVVTGIPMEFQFGTNWARLLRVRRQGRDRPDARDGRAVRVLPRVRRSSPCWSGASGVSTRRALLLGALALLARELAVGLLHRRAPTPSCSIPSATVARVRRQRCTSPISARSCSIRGRSRSTRTTMMARVVTASFVVAATGAYYLLRGEHSGAAAAFRPRWARSPVSCRASLVAFPTGDTQAKLVARHQPARSPRWRVASRAARWPRSH